MFSVKTQKEMFRVLMLLKNKLPYLWGDYVIDGMFCYDVEIAEDEIEDLIDIVNTAINEKE
jgi:hypothetical protein